MIELLSIKGFSNKGIRENNEDYILYVDKSSPNSRFIILCDGMGGHGHGEVASKIVANSVLEYLAGLSKTEYEGKDLQGALDYSVVKLTKNDHFDDQKAMGTTLVVAVVNKMNVLIGHVGDSRCYLFDSNGFKKFRTKDHSKVAEFVEAGVLTEDEAFESASKNLLTRCVMSGKENIKIDIDILQIENNDRLLLCSDGVVDAMKDKEIEECMINRSIEGALDIIDSICSSKSRDNYSAILVDFSQDEPSQIPSKGLQDPEEKDNEIKAAVGCRNCGEENPPSARYCRRCGSKLIPNVVNEEQVKTEKSPFDIILHHIHRIIRPTLFIILGAVLMKCCNWLANHWDIEESSANPKSELISKQLIDNFISELCSVDSTAVNKDSILRKDVIMNLYNEYCEEKFTSNKN